MERECDLKLLNSAALDYGLGSIKNVQRLNKGKTSKAWQVETVSGQFVFKTIKNTEQASFEFAVSSAVRQINPLLTPKILLSEKNQPFSQNDGKVYQIQVFLETKSLPSLPESLKSCCEMRQALDSFNTSFSPTDSKSLTSLWHDQKAALLRQCPILFQQVTATLPELAYIDQSCEAWVHGDLGKWNLLATETGRVAIIDFGETRLGPKYLDFAALFQGFMPDKSHNLSTYLNEFLFLSNIRAVNRHTFLMTVQLWLIKGLLIAIGKQDGLVATFQNAMELIMQLI